ncbi:HU family DNA-binding protein [Oribacterium sp. NK2B42]|uniref:HU family DNA-binding protein n=1 Tax=Oribacterium sp. NK2B42 TaxID=689781 RepID=UPI000425B336|nr:HU family DNA-binding protein [Oribacterium sp. NK2B42]
MTKQELIAEVAKRADITKKDAELVVKYTFETITEALERGDKFQLVGFGTFDVAERAAREARNPRDGSVMQIGPSKSARFKAGADLKKCVNG